MSKQLPWKTFIALIVIYVSLYYQWYWVWGVVFILWTIQSIKTEETYLVEVITRQEHPVIFWLILVTWLVVSAFMIIWDVLRLFWGNSL